MSEDIEQLREDRRRLVEMLRHVAWQMEQHRAWRHTRADILRLLCDLDESLGNE